MNSAYYYATPMLQRVVEYLHLATFNRLRHCQRHVEQEEWVKIVPGAYLNTDIFIGLKPWDCAFAVALARIISVCVASKRRVHGLSTALLLGIPLSHIPVDVFTVIYQDTSRILTAFPQVNWNGKRILGPGVLRQHCTSENIPTVPIIINSHSTELVDHRGTYPIYSNTIKPVKVCSSNNLLPSSPPKEQLEKAQSEGFLITSTPLSFSLLHIARTTSAEDAFVALCMGLQYATQQEHIRSDRERRRLLHAHSFLRESVAALPKSARGRQQATLLINNVDGGTDSVGEARLLWILKCAGYQGLSTQLPIQSWEQTFYIDIAHAPSRLAVEFDGFTKYEPGPRLKTQMSEQARRQRVIESEDFVVVRVLWERLSRPLDIVTEIEQRMQQVGRSVPRQSSAFSRRFGPEAFR